MRLAKAVWLMIPVFIICFQNHKSTIQPAIPTVQPENPETSFR
jgi:hypothetical protein